MEDFYADIAGTKLSIQRDKELVMDELIKKAEDRGLRLLDVDINKPWGGYARFDSAQADLFIHTFFPGLDSSEARLGNKDMELSPKFLLVQPGARLSWQRHARRAERWAYLTDGAYYKSKNPDKPGNQVTAVEGVVVQFAQGECHRLVGLKGDAYTLVAEIWQHTDPDEPSDEADIERLADDYNR